jgi:hypothetical protein
LAKGKALKYWDKGTKFAKSKVKQVKAGVKAVKETVGKGWKGLKSVFSKGRKGKKDPHAKVPNKPKTKTPEKPKLRAGTPEHKSARWNTYHEGGGKWNYERWSKQYDINMKNANYGLAREKIYRTQLGGISETVKTPFTLRQIDIHKINEMYAGQLKTGKVSLTKQAKIDIPKDAAMVKAGYKVEYILEKGASKPFLKALEQNGIKYHIGPKKL